MTTEDITTENKIKEAARKVFMQKGFGGARTKDIASEAGINLALLNYYFRSKERLFEIIVQESTQLFVGDLLHIVNDQATDLAQKIDLLVAFYADIMLNHPELPLFIVSEIQANPEKIMTLIHIKEGVILQSKFVSQIKELRQKLGKEEGKEYHIILNILSLSIFPAITKPIFKGAMAINETLYQQLMDERRQLIPIWINTMINH